MNSDNDSVFIKSTVSDVDALSATSDAFLNNEFSATSSAPIPKNFSLNNLETSVSELNHTVNDTLNNNQLPMDLEQELKKLLTDTENQAVIVGGGHSAKKYKINEGKAYGKRTRGVKSYETERDVVHNSSVIADFSLDESSEENTNNDVVKNNNEEKKVKKNDPLKQHREFVAYIQKKMGVKGGPTLQVFAKMYKDVAKDTNPDKSSLELTKDAQKLFDNDSKEEREMKYQQAVQKLADKKK